VTLKVRWHTLAQKTNHFIFQLVVNIYIKKMNATTKQGLIEKVSQLENGLTSKYKNIPLTSIPMWALQKRLDFAKLDETDANYKKIRATMIYWGFHPRKNRMLKQKDFSDQAEKWKQSMKRSLQAHRQRQKEAVINVNNKVCVA
jgi:hypothetical protein